MTCAIPDRTPWFLPWIASPRQPAGDLLITLKTPSPKPYTGGNPACDAILLCPSIESRFMKITIDTDARLLTYEAPEGQRKVDLYSDEAFGVISKQWLKVGWNQKYVYSFSWMGRPIIQLPEDMVRMQEVLYRVKPDVVIETGVAHGGSLIFYASLFKAMGKGRVIGVDIEIREHNRKAIEAHEMKPLIELIEGSSVDPDTVARVRSLIKPGERCLVILDSNHTRAHVKAELDAYFDLVAPGSY